MIRTLLKHNRQHIMDLESWERPEGQVLVPLAHNKVIPKLKALLINL